MIEFLQWPAMCLVVGQVCARLFYSKAYQRDQVVARLQQINCGFSARSSLIPDLLPSIKATAEIIMLLKRAGFNSDSAASRFMWAKLALMLLSGLTWLTHRNFSLTPFYIAEAFAFAIVGGLTTELWLKRRAKRIVSRIAIATPDALDLMVVCVESGLTLEAMFGRVGEEMAQICPELSREWLITEAELRLLDSRPRALKQLAERTGVEEIDNIVVALIQAEKYGSPIAKTMRLIASDSRQNQYLALEERVGKIPAKMSMPVVVLIMLPVVVIIVAPTFIQLLTTLGDL